MAKTQYVVLFLVASFASAHCLEVVKDTSTEIIEEEPSVNIRVEPAVFNGDVASQLENHPQVNKETTVEDTVTVDHTSELESSVPALVVPVPVPVENRYPVFRDPYIPYGIPNAYPPYFQAAPFPYGFPAPLTGGHLVSYQVSYQVQVPADPTRYSMGYPFPNFGQASAYGGNQLQYYAVNNKNDDCKN